MTQQIVRVTDETTKAELAITLEILNADAKRMSRRGKVGTLSDEYKIQHARINAVVTDWERART